jgi:DNA-binding XRE family transcriptional regulator
MLAVVKTPHTKTTAFKIVGSIDKETLDYLNARFGEENVGVDEEIIDVIDSGWYKNISKKVTPGTVVRTYRENMKLTQQQLAEKIDIGKSSYISDIEHGRRTVSKNLAKKFAEVFGVSVEMFL